MTKVEKAAVKKLELCIKAMLEAEKAIRPLHPDKADEIKGATGIAEEWIQHIIWG